LDGGSGGRFKVRTLGEEGMKKPEPRSAKGGKGSLQIRNSTAEFLVFTSQAGEKGIEVRVEDETVWLTQKLIGVLFEVDVRTVSEHLGNIFATEELDEGAAIRKFRNTASDGKSYLTAFYNLDAIIAVGFRVNSSRATQFRQWAIGILRDFAIHGRTAAELIVERADSRKAQMGLTTWRNAPRGKVLKPDVVVAKNYLTEKEIRGLDRIVTMYLDYAESQAERGIPMTMEDWAKRLNAFLRFNEREILDHPGKVSQEVARAFAESEFEKYRIVQDRLFESDFDRHVKKALGNGGDGE
jgi:hypothetical protein